MKTTYSALIIVVPPLLFHYVIFLKAGHVVVCRNIMSATLTVLKCSSFSFLLDIMSFTFTVFGRWDCLGI